MKRYKRLMALTVAIITIFSMTSFAYGDNAVTESEDVTAISSENTAIINTICPGHQYYTQTTYFYSITNSNYHTVTGSIVKTCKICGHVDDPITITPYLESHVLIKNECVCGYKYGGIAI